MQSNIKMANPTGFTRLVSKVVPKGVEEGFVRGVNVISAQPGKRYSVFSASYPKALAEAGITLGTEYPKPIVDLSESRNEALARFKALGDGK